MKLNQVTKAWLKSVAGSKIYQRGEHYFQSGMVYQIEFDPEKQEIHAEVSGNYGNYEVTATENEQKLNAYCDCPYDGHPCKHIVAVLLYFIEKKNDLIHQAEERKNRLDSLKKKLEQSSHEDLVHIIIEFARNDPDFERALVVKLEPENSGNLEIFLKQLRRIRLDDFEEQDNRVSELENVKELRRIMTSAENASEKIQVIVNWEIASKVLTFLNRYGISDERWENLVAETFETLSSAFSKPVDLNLNKEKDRIIEQLRKYHEWGNCGMADDISVLLETLND